jgi:phospholipid-binding lipoprotein MlaA
MKRWPLKIKNSLLTGLAACLTFSAAASFADSPRPINPADPYEPFNRLMFNFNDFMDKVLLKPVATLYNKIMPKPVSKGISNMFSNVDTITTVANDVLQFNFYQATSDTWRFMINTTIGIGGFFDVAEHMGLERNVEDLGLTFAKWGWKDTNYLVLPFIGPSTVRDGIAWPINYEALTIYPWLQPVGTRYAVYFTGVVSKRAELLRFENVMEQAALDRYVFMRDAYLQNRKYRIERNEQLSDPYVEKNNKLTSDESIANDSTLISPVRP